MIRTAVLICLLAMAGISHAEERRFTTDKEAVRWSGVGLLNMAGGGRCSGVLIRPDTVLTAAHCVSDVGAKTTIAPSNIRFYAGWRDGRAVEIAQAKKVTVHPGYFVSGGRYNEGQVRVDLARITLDRRMKKVPSYPVGFTPAVGAKLSLLSYSRGRMGRLSVQSGCAIARRATEFLLLDCTSNPGASGAPYFQVSPSGKATVVGINSGRRTGRSGAQALALAFAHVRDFIRAGGGRLAPVSNSLSSTAPSPSAGSGRVGRLPGGSLPGEGLKKLNR